MGVINECTQCGKKGLFLPLNNLGHCEECIKQNKAKRDGHGTLEIMPLTVETEDEATNFIFHNSSHINTQDNDSLFVIPIRGDDND